MTTVYLPTMTPGISINTRLKTVELDKDNRKESLILVTEGKVHHPSTPDQEMPRKILVVDDNGKITQEIDVSKMAKMRSGQPFDDTVQVTDVDGDGDLDIQFVESNSRELGFRERYPKDMNLTNNLRLRTLYNDGQGHFTETP